MTLIHLAQYGIMAAFFLAIWSRKSDSSWLMFALIVLLVTCSGALFYMLPAPAFGVIWIYAAAVGCALYVIARTAVNLCKNAVSESLLRSPDRRCHRPH